MSQWRVLAMVALLLGGCKTAEEIQRAQVVDQMALQMVNTQKLMADLGDRLQKLEDRINQMTGQFEESTHENRQLLNQNLGQLRSQVGVLQEDLQNKQQKLEAQEQQLKKQSQFISKLTNTLSRAQKGSKGQDAYSLAMSLYKEKKYKEAKTQLLALSQDKKIKGTKRARVYHNLGLINFMDKDYQQASVWMSKIYADHPRTSYVKNALLFLGKSFSAMGKKDEANEAWNELIKKYPDSYQGKQAKKLLQ